MRQPSNYTIYNTIFEIFEPLYCKTTKNTTETFQTSWTTTSCCWTASAPLLRTTRSTRRSGVVSGPSGADRGRRTGPRRGPTAAAPRCARTWRTTARAAGPAAAGGPVRAPRARRDRGGRRPGRGRGFLCGCSRGRGRKLGQWEICFS